jgi:hypothetical protein
MPIRSCAGTGIEHIQTRGCRAHREGGLRGPGEPQAEATCLRHQVCHPVANCAWVSLVSSVRRRSLVAHSDCIADHRGPSAAAWRDADAVKQVRCIAQRCQHHTSHARRQAEDDERLVAEAGSVDDVRCMRTRFARDVRSVWSGRDTVVGTMWRECDSAEPADSADSAMEQCLQATKYGVCARSKPRI